MISANDKNKQLTLMRQRKYVNGSFNSEGHLKNKKQAWLLFTPIDLSIYVISLWDSPFKVHFYFKYINPHLAASYVLSGNPVFTTADKYIENK